MLGGYYFTWFRSQGCSAQLEITHAPNLAHVPLVGPPLQWSIGKFSKQGTSFHRSIAMVFNETTNYDFVLSSKTY